MLETRNESTLEPASVPAPEYAFSHRDLRRALPPELFERRASAIVGQLFISFFSTAAAYVCMSWYSPWFTLPAYWTFLGERVRET